MLRQTTVTALIVVALNSLAPAANDAVIREMDQVIASDARIPAETRAGLRRIVSDVLVNTPELAGDKRLRVGQDLKCYLDDMVPMMRGAAPKFFENTFRWNLTNFALLPPASDLQRKQLRKAIRTLSTGVRPAIDALYLDTPEPVRAEMAGRVEAWVESLLASGRVGNYFYPQYLYPPPQQVRPEKVLKEWRRDPDMTAKRHAFAPVAEIQRDPAVPEESRQSEVRTFLNREAALLQIRMGQMVHLSDLTRLQPGQFVPMPKELEKAYLDAARASTKNTARMVQESQELLDAARAAGTRAATRHAPASHPGAASAPTR